MNIQIGPLAFQRAHVMALVCALIAVAVGWLVGRKKQLGISDVLLDMLLVAVPAGRAVFVAIWFAVYQDNPWSIFDIRDGGVEPWSALLAALCMAAWRVRQRPALLQPLGVGVLAGASVCVALFMGGFTGEPVSQRLPAVRLVGVDAQPVDLPAQWDGRPMVVNLWATWCPPCQHEMPALARAQTMHPGINFVFVNEGESLDVVLRYLRRVPFHLDRVLVDEGNALGRAIDSTALPTTLIYGRDGQLVYSRQGMISEAVLAMQLERCCGVKP